MTAVLLALLTALAAGLRHALEPDHMGAVTTFVSRGARPLQALGFGVRWGLGHSLAILAVGSVLIVLDLDVPEGFARGLEFGVGAMLLGLGLWLLWSLLHEGAHQRMDPGADRHTDHGGRVTGWVGVAHGLAGTAPLIGILPVALIESPLLAAGYLLLFGVGTVLAMGAYAWIIGLVFHHSAHRSRGLARGLRAATALG
ncbi:MAG: hypothetical protein M3P24_11005, partial [Gemmatimonadota bacterium]|nr:hypothetical protein [Gemmatimonadota bacterium]